MMAVSPYTYDDLDDSNDTDFNMDHFSIDKDKDFVIPILKEALEINPDLKILGSPWSAPAWMKDSHKLFGGYFNSAPDYMRALAQYLIKFVQAYEEEGVPIESFTVQNEPTIERFDYPTMIMNVSEMTEFVKNYLGPMMRENNITAKLLVWDFNWIDPWYPDAILSDGLSSFSIVKFDKINMHNISSMQYFIYFIEIKKELSINKVACIDSKLFSFMCIYSSLTKTNTCGYFDAVVFYISADAKQYISGIAWHGYEGDYETPRRFYEKYPDMGTNFQA